MGEIRSVGPGKTPGVQEKIVNTVCQPVWEIIHELKLVDYLFVQADKPWYIYNTTPLS